MSTHNHIHDRRGGFTLVEALIAVTFLAVMFIAVAQTSSRASDAFDEGSAEHALSTSTHRALDRIASVVELSDASIFAGLVPDLGADHVDFRVPVDFVGTTVTWAEGSIHAELEPGELDDGVDNDHDGLIDERRVVLTQDVGTPEERSIVLAAGVAEYLEGELPNSVDDNGNGLTDEAGLSFSVQGSVLTIRITCQRRDEAKRLLTKTSETAVRLINSGV